VRDQGPRYSKAKPYSYDVLEHDKLKTFFLLFLKMFNISILLSYYHKDNYDSEKQHVFKSPYKKMKMRTCDGKCG